MKNNVLKSIYDIGVIILIFIASNIFVTTLLQFVNIPITIFNIFFASSLTIFIYYILRKNTKKYIICNIIIAALIILISIIISGMSYDLSYDGNYYHKPAVGMLKQGWNPIKESSYDYNLRNNPEMLSESVSLWVDHYPKASWNFGANIYSITNNIESGKSITILILTSFIFILFAYISLKNMKPWKSLIITIAISLNPIVLPQLFSYYVDGLMGILIYMIILFLIVLDDKNLDFIKSNEKWLLLLIAIALTMNIKFTGIFFSAIFVFIFYIYWLIRAYKASEFKVVFLKLTRNFAVIVAISIFIIGFSTYVKNLVEHVNPLYPLLGENKVDIITSNQPVSFAEKNRFTKFFESIFSESINATYVSKQEPILKAPFTFKEYELFPLTMPDTRLGGFGVYSSGIFIVSIAVLAYTLIRNKFNSEDIKLYTLLILTGILVTTILIEESWWARYSPQLWLLPALALINLFNINVKNNNIKRYVINLVGVTIFISITLNSVVFINNKMDQLNLARTIRKEMYIMNDISKNNNINVSIETNQLFGLLYNLKDNKINYNFKLQTENIEETNKIYNNWIKYQPF